MTNEEAIKVLEEMITAARETAEKQGVYPITLTVTPGLFEALDTMLKTLKAEPCEDVIGRQPLLERMNAYCDLNCVYSKRQRETMCRACMMGYAIEFVEDAPPVQPKVVPIAEIRFDDDKLREIVDEAIKNIEIKPEWIPVTERLPEESLNSVIGWDGYRERCVFVQYIDGHFQITGKPESFDIVAWMPLPEPYKGEVEG